MTSTAKRNGKPHMAYPEFDVCLRYKNVFSGELYPARIHNSAMDHCCYLNIYAKFCLTGKMYFMNRPAVKQISFIRDDTFDIIEEQDKYVAVPACEEFLPIYEFFLKSINQNGGTAVEPKQGDLVYINDSLSLQQLQKVVEETKSNLDISQFQMEDTLDTLLSMADWVCAVDQRKDADIERAIVVVFDTAISNKHFS